MDSPAAVAFRKNISNRFKFKLFLLRKLPMAYLAGLRVVSLTAEKAVVSVPYKYLTQNPFRSIYFACLAMAGELSSGLLAMMGVYGASPSVSMLVVKMEAGFFKKGTGLIYFTCSDGDLVREAIAEAKNTGQSTTVTTTSVGTDAAGDKVAEFRITWSFKARKVS